MSNAKKAIVQIEEKEYITELRREAYQKIMTYGIAFCEKRCRVIQGQTITE